MRSTYYRKCQYCGSNLDPGEQCDCRMFRRDLGVKQRYSEAVKTVIFRKAWSSIFNALDDASAGQLIKALCGFMNGENPEIDNVMVSAVYGIMANQIEESSRRYYERLQDQE